ncbi:MAG: hypothetical protein ACLGHQ_14685 [Acidimicrobiia bacterium]
MDDGRAVSDASGPGSTPRKDVARSPVTKTTITPAPGTTPPPEETPEPQRRGLRPGAHGRLTSARPPLAGATLLRRLMSVLLGLLCLSTIGGAILMLLLWQQDRDAGVLSSQLDRTWDLFADLRVIERWVAFAVVPVAMAWIGLATLNVRRATGQRRNPFVAALSLPVGLAGVWLMGDQIIGRSDDWLGQLAGFVLQAVFLAIPWLALERVAVSAEARRGALRATYAIAVAYLAGMQFLAGVSTVDETADATEWGRLGAYLVIGALLQVLGALSANEGARAIEDGTEHRFGLRQRFGESLLHQAERGQAI